MNRILEDDLDLSEEMKRLEEEGNRDRREEGDAESYIDKHLKAADIARYLSDPDNFYDNEKEAGEQLTVLADSSEGLEKISYGIRSVRPYFEAGKEAEKNKDFSKSLNFYEKAADVAYLVAESRPADERQEWYNLVNRFHFYALEAAEAGDKGMEVEKVKERRRNLNSKMTNKDVREAPNKLPFNKDYLF